MTPKKKRTKTAPLLGIALLAAVTVAWGLGPGDWFGLGSKVTLAGAEVQRDRLTITVVERGNLESANSVSLKSEVEGSATILYLIEEGREVTPGELLCELDTSGTEEKLVSQSIAVQNAQAAHEKAKQTHQIQISQNESDIAAAERNKLFAETDLEKYIEGDMIQLRKDKEQSITLAEEQLTRDANQLEWSKKLADKDFLTATELEGDQLAYNRSLIDLDRAERDLDLFTQYEAPRAIAELEADVVEAGRELERVKLQATARLADYVANLETSKAKLDLEQEKLTKYLDQIEKARIYAPVSGMVVYGRESGHRWGQGDPMAEGTSVRERQEVIQIPVTEGMIAEVSLHESVVDQVQVGQLAKLSFDALPGRQYTGRVKFKAVLPDKNSWWANPNLRLYRTEIEVLDPDDDMRPGMTCNVEIFVDEIPDCVYVPVQAVFLDGNQTVVFIDSREGTEKREVETGRNSHKWVEITAGLSGGELVKLSLPPDQSLEAGTDLGADQAPEMPPMPGMGSDMGSGMGPGMGEAQRPGGGSVPAGMAGGRPGGAGAQGSFGGGQRSSGAAEGQRPGGDAGKKQSGPGGGDRESRGGQ